MTEHTIHSPTWGPLRLSATEDNPEDARPWRTVILNRPGRLQHLVQTMGTTEDDAVEVMVGAVERDSPVGVTLRASVRELH